jgi:hypothetical protein
MDLPMPLSPSSLCLRAPEPGKPELSMSIDGQSMTINLSQQQLWHLVSEGLKQIKNWPLRAVEKEPPLPTADL